MPPEYCPLNTPEAIEMLALRRAKRLRAWEHLNAPAMSHRAADREELLDTLRSEAREDIAALCREHCAISEG